MLGGIVTYMGTRNNKCTALLVSKTRPCKMEEYMPGSNVCKYHGGRLFVIAHKALRRSVLTRVSKINEVTEGTLVYTDNPFDMLNRAAIDSKRFLDLIEAKLNHMAEEGESWRYQDKAGAEQLRSEVALWERAQDRMIRAANALAKLNLEERFTRLSEQQAASMMYIINEVFKRCGLDESEREKAKQFVPVVIEEMMTQTGKKRYI